MLNVWEDKDLNDDFGGCEEVASYLSSVHWVSFAFCLIHNVCTWNIFGMNFWNFLSIIIFLALREWIDIFFRSLFCLKGAWLEGNWSCLAYLLILEIMVILVILHAHEYLWISKKLLMSSALSREVWWFEIPEHYFFLVFKIGSLG